MTQISLVQWIPKFRRARVLVVGDVMLDEFVWGKVTRISPEAPVPVVWVQSDSVMPGGAANVANNVGALGARVSLVGMAGTDRWGTILLEDLKKRRVDVSGIVQESARPTIVKTRVIAHHQQVVRVDREATAPLASGAVKQLISAVRDRLDDVDAVIIEDYGKGVINRALLEAIVPLARAKQKVITVDPKEDHFDLYRGVTAITPNRAEAGVALKRELATDQAVTAAGRELQTKLACEAVLMTLGESGMALFESSGRHTRISTVAQEVFDVAGAGDTVIATFTLALACGAPMAEAALLANTAAGIVVGKLGVAVTSPEELTARLKQVGAGGSAAAPARSARPQNLRA